MKLHSLALGLTGTVLLAFSMLSRAQRATHLVTGSTVSDGPVRIEVLGPGLLRLEYSADGHFEDATTFNVVNRDFPHSRFQAKLTNGQLSVRTGNLELTYRLGSGPFSSKNLSVRVHRDKSFLVAHPDFSGPGETCDPEGVCREHNNLGGWFSGLDKRTEAVTLHPGIFSRDGWYLVDDTRSALYTPGQWPRPRKAHDGVYQDGYFFGYGEDYRGALTNFVELTGHAPLLPRWAFGVWLGICCDYSADDYESDILPKARLNRMPLDVLTVDTQWKEPDKVSADSKESRAWNDWEWSSSKFPEPQHFMDWASGQGLHISLNIHPSINPRDPQYAKTLAIAGTLLPDPDKGVPAGSQTWDLGLRAHADSYFALHEPFVHEGVRFWWMDGCCGEGISTLDGVTPTAWISALYADRTTPKDSRPFVLSRIGGTDKGYGSSETTPTGPWAEHRYAIHFTGDSFANWNVLGFESTFTAHESGIGEPYISHDIGGFHGAHLADDLYVRWIQLGTFSPIMRLHGAHGDRLPWQYHDPANAAASEFLRLRDELAPYVYTAARIAHDTGLPISRPLFMDYPNQEEAYKFDQEYFFGDSLLVAPVATPGDPAQVTLWIPPGAWVDFFTGEKYMGPKLETISMPLARMPVLVRAGSIIPMKPYEPYIGASTLPTLLHIYPGADSEYRLYDDDGEGLGYEHGNFSWTTFRSTQGAKGRIVQILPASERYDKKPMSRLYELCFEAASPDLRVIANGHILPGIEPDAQGQGVWFTPASHTLHVRLGSLDGKSSETITVQNH